MCGESSHWNATFSWIGEDLLGLKQGPGPEPRMSCGEVQDFRPWRQQNGDMDHQMVDSRFEIIPPWLWKKLFMSLEQK